MRRIVTCLMLGLFVIAGIVGFAALAAGCAPAGYVNAAALDSTFRRVADRHDRYVDVDPSIGDVERRVDLRDTALLRAVLDAAKNPTPTTMPSR